MTMRKGMLVLVVLVCVVLGGCQLAREDGEGSSKTMVGVLLTTGARPTFAEENGQEPRLYAQVSEDYDVTFPETEGYLMAVARFTNAQGEGVNVTACDEDISMSELHIASGDVERVSFTGTLYVNTSKLTAQGQEVVYVNPVYQDGEGRIWAEPGAGIALSPDVEGGMWTNTYTSTHTEQAGEESQTYESAVTVKIAPRYPPLQTVVHEMSGDNQVLCTQAYEPGGAGWLSAERCMRVSGGGGASAGAGGRGDGADAHRARDGTDAGVFAGAGGGRAGERCGD